MHADFCPSADADCSCDIVVTDVGADLADQVLIPNTNLTIDIAERSLQITTTPSCECLGCPCSYSLVLDATEGLLSLDLRGARLHDTHGRTRGAASGEMTTAVKTVKRGHRGGPPCEQ